MVPAGNSPFRILSLDGGGGKGVYTLGVLREVEKHCGKPLNQVFSLFYGTSTGSIIAAALANGASVDEILTFYFNELPAVMKTFCAGKRSTNLQAALSKYFKEMDFQSLNVGLGLVATNLTEKRAVIFKSLPQQAHGMKGSFKAGFGLKVADAVEASCSAHPFFHPKRLELHGTPTDVIDGGFVANNPSLYALVDVRQAFQIADNRIKFLSIGTGTFPESYPFYSYLQGVRLKPALKMISMQFSASANSIEKVFDLMAIGIEKVRVNDSFTEPELATSLFEYRDALLKRLLGKGRDSYAKYERDIQRLVQ